MHLFGHEITSRDASAIRFWLERATSNLEIPEHPMMPTDVLKTWRASLEDCATYLEYGAGGSTVEAAQLVPHVVSVESDAAFARAVATRLPVGRDCTVMHADIGWTWALGKPYVTFPNKRRLQKWSNYAELPWKSLQSRNLKPDVIFIDGRFRVACTLRSLQAVGRNCKILFDDFHRRPWYATILAYAEIVDEVENLVVLKKKADFDEAQCSHDLEIFSKDWR